MQTFATMPHGYRWLTQEEADEYADTDDHRWGWMKYVAICTNTFGVQEYTRPWDCMIEFGMDHDHSETACAIALADMNPDYGVSEHYNNGVKEYY